MKTNKTDYVYSGKDFLKTILLIFTFELFVIFVIAGICSFSGVAINSSFPLEVGIFLFLIIAGAEIVILLTPQLILFAILYFARMRDAYLIINEKEINLSKYYIGPINSKDKKSLSVSKISSRNNTALIIPWRNIEKIKFHKICKGIHGVTPDYYYFIIMCKHNISYLKPINEYTIAKIEKKIKQCNKDFLINN